MAKSEVKLYTTVPVSADDRGLQTKDDRVLSSRECAVLSIWHMMTGAVTVIHFNAFLNSTVFMKAFIWPQMLTGAVILGTQLLGSISAATALTFFGNYVYSINLVRLVNFTLILCGPLVMVPVNFLGGPSNTASASFVISLITMISGSCMGAMQTQSFAFACLIPRQLDQTILVQVGQGVAGVLCWVVVTPLFEWIYMKDPAVSKIIIGVVFGVATTVVAISALVAELVVRIKPLEEERRAVMLRAHHEKRATLESLRPIIFKSFLPACVPAFTLFTTLLVFPVVGPLSWPVVPTARSLYIGLYQLASLFGKIALAFCPLARMEFKPVAALSVIRFAVLVPLFLIPMYLPVGETSYAAILLPILVVFHALSNAMCHSNGIIHCMKQSQSRSEERVIASVMTMLLLIGASAGSFASECLVRR